MNDVLQAILIAGEAQRDKVLNNTKKITIREGIRGYRLGRVLIGCHLLCWATMKEIIEVKHLILRYVPREDFKADGFESREEMLYTLKEYYPYLTLDSLVTVVRWK